MATIKIIIIDYYYDFSLVITIPRNAQKSPEHNIDNSAMCTAGGAQLGPLIGQLCSAVQ
jgi:hypothetical protein